MLQYRKSMLVMLLFFWGSVVHATDLAGKWQHVDDKTGSIKAVLDMRKEANGLYNAKILKLVPAPGITAKTLCDTCPAPFSNKPIAGLDILTGLSETPDGQFTGGKILDPINGELMNAKAKLSSNGNRLMLRCVLPNKTTLTQVWMRVNP